MKNTCLLKGTHKPAPLCRQVVTEGGNEGGREGGTYRMMSSIVLMNCCDVVHGMLRQMIHLREGGSDGSCQNDRVDELCVKDNAD